MTLNDRFDIPEEFDPVSWKCPQCGALSKTEMKTIGKDKASRICLNNWHTRYPDKPVEVKYTGPIEEPNHPELPSEPGAPHFYLLRI